LPNQLDVWRAHFGGLATDITGNSQDPGKWQTIAGDETLPALAGLDADLTMANVWKALQGMKTHRAPGGDGIPTDFYRSALKEKERHAEWVKARAQANQGDPEARFGGINFGSNSEDEPQASTGGAGAGGAKENHDGTEDRDGGAKDNPGRAGGPRGDDQEPSLFMTTALLDLLNCVWSTGTVVDDWIESIVVSFPKKR
jgi:hypothetical protein